MAWFDDVWSGVSDLFGGAGGLGSALINAGSRIYGASQASEANTDAARIAADAALRGTALSVEQMERARAERAAAAQRGIAAIRAGTTDYANVTAPLLAERPIMLPAYRGLTPSQEIARDDLRRQGLATVAASGMRGSPAGIRTVMDQDRRFLADAAARTDSTNLAARQDARRTTDTARSALGQVYAQQGGSIANTEIGAANQNATGLERIGATLAGGATAAGQAQAGALTANASLTADTVGALGSIIADQMKTAALRERKYGPAQAGV